MAQAALADIIDIFVREATIRFAEMARALEALEGNPADLPALSDLMRRFHSFADVGGLDGFEIINSLGSRGEAECRRLIAQGTAPSPEQLRRWTSIIDVMKSEIEEARRSVASAPATSPVVASALVVDIGLPDGSGYEVIERLRALSPNVERSSVARILSVEDDPDQAAYLRAVLESAGYEVQTCSDPREFESELARFAPDLILMDILLPNVSGYELARFARQHEEHQTTPILFLTTEGKLHTRIQSMRSGGDDHIVKPVVPNLLLAAVETRLDRSRQLRQSLDRDSLTGLLNRAAFLRRVQARIRKGGEDPASLVMLDVDHFKHLNDTYGHAFGDHVLARLGAFLRAHLRGTDHVCRYGGEEFTLLIDDVSEDDAVRLVDRLREEFASIPHLLNGGEPVFATFSAGVAALPNRVSAMPHVLESADAALYRAKAEGRNRVCAATLPFPSRISA